MGIEQAILWSELCFVKLSLTDTWRLNRTESRMDAIVQVTKAGTLG